MMISIPIRTLGPIVSLVRVIRRVLGAFGVLGVLGSVQFTIQSRHSVTLRSTYLYVDPHSSWDILGTFLDNFGTICLAISKTISKHLNRQPKLICDLAYQLFT